MVISHDQNMTPLEKRTPREQLRLAFLTSAIVKNPEKEWELIEADLEGCTLNISTVAEQRAIRWAIKGMTKEKAEFYNSRYAKTLSRGLLGIGGTGTFIVEFEAKEGSE